MLKSRRNPIRSECKNYLKNIYATIDELEKHLLKSEQTDRQILMGIRLEHLREQGITTQLKESQKENQNLINMLQSGTEEIHMSRSTSDTSGSTMSLVHLQYKYEELLSNQQNLLKLLEMRLTETRKYQEENERLREEIESSKFRLETLQHEYSAMEDRMREIKIRKNQKISKLRSERDTLRVVHNRMVGILDKQITERDDVLSEELRSTSEPDKALLLQEIRKNNSLVHENFRMKQKIEYLESILSYKQSKANRSRTSANLART